MNILDGSYGDLEDYLRDMQKIIHDQKESFSLTENLKVRQPVHSAKAFGPRIPVYRPDQT